ncbi:MAG: hypothetical protein J2P53_01335 [Bradyrhizobiaceae bacterium]|nr:hypothetical protein [Bradyrhizobiaceae bacterium]
MRGTRLPLTVIIVAASLGGAGARGQSLPSLDPPPGIWDIELGIAVSALPLKDFVDPACGTNGGPPARVLKGFDEFALCPAEAATGLHEVWFRYDDEMEYIARARRSSVLIRQYQANSLAGQPIITSLLIDDAGRVQGYRIINDPRADAATRIDAFNLADLFKGIAGMGLPCTDLPPADGERPIDDVFIKEICELETDGKVVRVEQRRYYKAGQYAVDPDSRATENQFESAARLEVYRRPR